MFLARAVSVEIVSKNITGLYVTKKKKRKEYEMQRCSFRHAEKWDGKLNLKNTIMTQMNTDSEKLLM